MTARKRALFGLICLALVLAIVPVATTGATSVVLVAQEMPPTAQIGADGNTTALPEGVSGDWWGTVQEDIRLSEYKVTWQESTYLPDLPAAYQAPNRAQNLRTYFTPAGIRTTPRTDTTPSWELGLSLTGYGYEGNTQPVAIAKLAAADIGTKSEDDILNNIKIEAPRPFAVHFLTFALCLFHSHFDV